MRQDHNYGRNEKLFACFCILPLIARFVLSYLFSAVAGDVTELTVSFALSAVLNAFSWVLPFGIYGFLSKTKTPEKGREKPLYAVYVFFSAYFAASLLSVLYSYILMALGCEIPKIDISGYGVAQIAIFVISSVVLVPLAEEFAFRKILLSNLLPFGRVPAIIISAVLFAVCHHPSSYVYSFVFGIALAKVSLDFGYKYSMSLHAANNSISCIYMLLERHLSEASYGVALIARLTLMSGLGLYCTAKILKTRCKGGKES